MSGVSIDTDGAAENHAPTAFEHRWRWRGGALAGLLAAVAMGAVISITNLDTIRLAIAGLYGLRGSLLAGWLAHVVHGTLFGLLFAAVLSDPGLARVGERHRLSVPAGLVYGVVLAVAGAGVIMPIWLTLAGVPDPPTVVNLDPPVLLWHLVYGGVLGSVFPLVRGR